MGPFMDDVGAQQWSKWTYLTIDIRYCTCDVRKESTRMGLLDLSDFK